MTEGQYQSAYDDPHALRCKFCGESAVYWVERKTRHGAQWLLYDADTQTQHKCEEYLAEVRMKEGKIREALKKRVEAYGGEIRAVAWLGRSNAPDVLCLFPVDSWYCRRYPLEGGEHVWVETKRPKKDATEAQKREHARMREAGCVVYVITTLEELNAWLPPLH